MWHCVWTLLSTFFSDVFPTPDWLKARAESERNGPIVANIENMILTPTAYSKLK